MQLMVSLFLPSVTCCITILISVPKGIQYNLVGSGNGLSQGVIQSNLYYMDQDYPDIFIIRTFFPGPNFFMNINY